MAIQGIGGIGKSSAPKRTKQYRTQNAYGGNRQPYNRNGYGNNGRGVSGGFDNVGAMVSAAHNYPLASLGYTLGRFIGNKIDQNNDRKQSDAMSAIRDRINSARGISNEYNDADEFIGLNRPQNDSTIISGDPINGVQISTPSDRAKNAVIDSKLDKYSIYGDNPSQAMAQEKQIGEMAAQYRNQDVYSMNPQQRRQFIAEQIRQYGPKISSRRQSLMLDKLCEEFDGLANQQAAQKASDELLNFYSGKYTPEQYFEKIAPLYKQMTAGGHINEAMAMIKPYTDYQQQRQNLANKMYEKEQMAALNNRLGQMYGTASVGGGRASSGGSGRASSGGRATTKKEVDPIDAEIERLNKDKKQIQGLLKTKKNANGIDVLDEDNKDNAASNEKWNQRINEIDDKIGKLIERKAERTENYRHIAANGLKSDGDFDWRQIMLTGDAMDKEMAYGGKSPDERAQILRQWIDGEAAKGIWGNTNPDMLYDQLNGSNGYIQRQRAYYNQQ